MTITSNNVYCGDCVKILGQVNAGSVDLVFADPPFNIGYEYDVYQDKRSCQEYLDWSAAWMRAVGRVLKPTGSFWLAIGDEYAAELKLVAQRQAGFHCRSWVIWYYTFGVNCVRGFSRSHTHLFHFVRDPKHFTFNGVNPAVRVLSARQLVYADARANGNGRLPDNTWITRPQDAPATAFDPMHDTWHFARVAGTFNEREGFHGCQMPEQLLGRIIRVSSHPMDLVLDPFAGSGTTLAVAKKLVRQWIGIELSREYVKRIKTRLGACRSGDELVGPEDPRRSAPATNRGRSKLWRRTGKRVVPKLDEETQHGIIDAYNEVSQGSSTDFILCEPELNSRFVEACQKRSLPGSVSTWNRLLLRIRKSGKLPRQSRARRQLSLAEMDPYSAASEIAMQLVTVDFGRTLDEILCSPHLAAELDRLAGEFSDGRFTAFQYRWAAMAIRKRASAAKDIAKQRAQDWSAQPLPPRKPLEACLTSEYDHAGLYVLLNDEHPLYVGETFSIRYRLQQVRETKAWNDLEPSHVRVLPGSECQMRHGFQSFLIDKTDPMLNWHGLKPKRTVAR